MDTRIRTLYSLNMQLEPARHGGAPATFVPRLRLFTERVLVDSDDIDTAVIQLEFDYARGARRDLAARETA